MSAGNLYRTFPSKESIVEGLCARDQQERIDSFVRFAEEGSVFAAFEAGLREHFATRTRDKARLVLEVWAEGARNPTIAAMSLAVDADIVGKISHVIRIAKERGQAQPSVDVEFERALPVHLFQRTPETAGARTRLRRRAGGAARHSSAQGLVRRSIRPERDGGPAMNSRPRRSRFPGRPPRRGLGLRQDGALHADRAESPRDGLAHGKPGLHPRRRRGRGSARRSAAARRDRRAGRAPRIRRPALRLGHARSAREEAQVAARIDGLSIVELDAEDGDRVKQGQVLARLDRSPARRAARPERRRASRAPTPRSRRPGA